MTSSGMAANMAALSNFTKIQIYQKIWKLEIFFPKVVKYKYDTFNSLFLSVAILVFFFITEKGEKRAFVFKNGLTLETGHYLSPVGVRGFFLRHNNFHKALIVF